jgi:transmembrane sensor
MPDKKDNKIPDALRRFFSGKKSEEGKKIYDQWFRTFDDSEGYLNRLNDSEKEEYKKNVFRSIQKKLNKSSSRKPVPLHKKRPGKFSVFYRVAAILIIGALLSLAGVYLSGVSEPVDIPVVMVERSNPVGQISEFTLPDGSTVWLSAASTLEYPEQFSDENRTVTLDGEAFFDVEQDESRPFVVSSGPLTTSVLGTSFNVTAYQDDPGMEVTLATGRVEVAVQDSEQKQILEPNQKIRYQAETGLSEVSEADALLARAWTQRELVFMREDFATIARTFERWYGVEFVFEDESLKEETFVYHFRELSLQNSMIVLNELAEFDYEIEGQRVIIR